MEYAIQTLNAVAEQLKNLFADKSELRGFNDWDALIGCVVGINQVIAELQEQQQSQKTPKAEE